MTDRQDDIHVPQGVLDLYDEYAHGIISRRDFMERLKAFAVGGVSVAALAGAVMPKYASARQIKAGDARIQSETLLYEAPKGAGEMAGLFVKPAGMDAPRGGVVVIHENRGLNPHIEDVARRVAVAGYVAFAPDALYPLGGYPGNDDDGRALQRERDREKMVEDFVAAAEFLKNHEACDGRVACVGFCFGGFVANEMAARIPWLAAAVPFYGGWPDAEDAANVKAPLLIHLGGLDERVNAGWPEYEAALRKAGADYQVYVYEGANHGFHNDTTPRYDADAAKLAWDRTLAFFEKHIG